MNLHNSCSFDSQITCNEIEEVAFDSTALGISVFVFWDVSEGHVCWWEQAFEGEVQKRIHTIKPKAAIEVKLEVDRQRRNLEDRTRGLEDREKMLREMELELITQYKEWWKRHQKTSWIILWTPACRVLIESGNEVHQRASGYEATRKMRNCYAADSP